MSAVGWSLGGEPDQEHCRLLAQPFDPSRLSMVSTGTCEHCSWELHDGPHPLIRDPHAVASRLIVRREDGSGGDGGSVSPPLGDNDIAEVSGSAGGVGAQSHGFLEARCSRAVTNARVQFDDGTTEIITAVASTSTGQHWIVCPLHGPASPTRIDLIDANGTVLLAKPVDDPRRHGIPDRRHARPEGRRQPDR